MDRLALFLDTNVYIHYTFFTDILWGEILRVTDICLVIPPVTFGEIERRKFGNNPPRVRDRAAAVARKLDELSESAQEVRPGVGIEFLHVEPVEFDTYQLSRDSQDDQLIASILEFKKRWEFKIQVITADGGMRRKCIARGIEATRLSDDYLVKEDHGSQKRIQELEQKLRTLESIRPNLTVQFADGSSLLEVTRTIQPRSDSEFIEREMKAIKREYPERHLRESNPSDPVPGLRNAFLLMDSIARNFHDELDPADLERYNSELKKFYEDYDFYLYDRLSTGAFLGRVVKLEIKIANNGTMPAEDIRVFIYVHRDPGMKVSDKKIRQPEKPKPPREPRMKNWYAQFPLASDLPLIRTPTLSPNVLRPLPPPTVVWNGFRDDGDSSIASFEVRKLNHGYTKNCPRIMYVIFDTKESMHSFKIDYEITAGNLPTKTLGSLHVLVRDPGNDSHQHDEDQSVTSLG